MCRYFCLILIIFDVLLFQQIRPCQFNRERIMMMDFGDSIVTGFDDFDFESFSNMMNETELDFLLNSCDSQSQDTKQNDDNISKKNSTLASLLRPQPSTAFVPPAPQISVGSNSVIETGEFKPIPIDTNESDKHPQLKSALIQEKSLNQPTHPVMNDTVNSGFYSCNQSMPYNNLSSGSVNSSNGYQCQPSECTTSGNVFKLILN